jgi:hypothetical protein
VQRHPDCFSGLGRRRDGALFANRSANTGFERMAAQLHGLLRDILTCCCRNKRGTLRIVPACVVAMVILCAARSLRGRREQPRRADRGRLYVSRSAEGNPDALTTAVLPILLIQGDGWKPGKLAAFWISATHPIRFHRYVIQVGPEGHRRPWHTPCKYSSHSEQIDRCLEQSDLRNNFEVCRGRQTMKRHPSPKLSEALAAEAASRSKLIRI